MRRLSALFFLFIWLISDSCQLNRTVNGYKEGRWIYATDLIKKDFELLKKRGYPLPKELNEGYYYKGRYRKDAEIGTWRYFMDGHLVRKEKYNGSAAYVRFYHRNGKIDCEGNTFSESAQRHIHWYYTGLWKCYNEKGILVVTRNYEKGKLINEELILKQ